MYMPRQHTTISKHKGEDTFMGKVVVADGDVGEDPQKWIEFVSKWVEYNLNKLLKVAPTFL
jgi:hypothetical protein